MGHRGFTHSDYVWARTVLHMYFVHGLPVGASPGANYKATPLSMIVSKRMMSEFIGPVPLAFIDGWRLDNATLASGVVV